MSDRHRLLWTSAIGGSLVVHGGLIAAVLAMPAPSVRAPAPVSIDIAAVGAGDVTRLASPPRGEVRPAPAVAARAALPRTATAVEATATRRPAAVTATQTMTAAPLPPAPVKPKDTPGAALPAAATPTAATPAADSSLVVAAVPTGPAEAARPTATAALPVDDRQPLRPADSAPVPSASTTQPLPATTPASETASRASSAPVEATVQPAQRAATQAAPSVVDPARAWDGTVAAIDTAAVAATPAAREARQPIVAAGTQPVAVAPAGRNPVGAPSPTVSTAAAPSQAATVAAARAPPTARPEAVRPSVEAAALPGSDASSPPLALAPVPTGASPTVVAAPQPNAGDDPASVADGEPTQNEQVAGLMPRPADPQASSGRGSGGRGERLADFLAEHQGDCLLALPDKTGTTQAAIDGFAHEPEAMARLGAEYQRVSGMQVTSNARRVSREQCGALAFARNLSLYPNFPLRVSLTASRIASGTRLEGVVSGLRRGTLYVMIVDDEGKAQLVQQFEDVRSSAVRFAANMTLTQGPVSGEQLLVAIVSDGPLDAVPERPGVPADGYFSRLATELFLEQRPILYGITSFVVR